MNKTVIFAAFLSVVPMTAFAQTTTPADTTTTETPAVATPETTNPDAPVPGKNSFTESQARDRMMEAGYTDVAGLKLDDQGFWQATAKKDTVPVNVVMDYQGNIVVK